MKKTNERIFIRETPSRVGDLVLIKGWVRNRRDHGKVTFIDLVDKDGIALQVVVTPENKDAHELAQTLHGEDVVAIEGTVKERPKGMQNEKLETGAIELETRSLTVLNRARESLPIPVDGAGYDINEESRLKYRYLDLRRTRLQRNIKLRDAIVHFMRNFLHNRGFIEVETPILTKSTPEGARDYVVPSRIQPGKFYALPQSPQQYKQLLMVAGFERYFQIAKCFRDEDTRGDRQPEFTQLDIEMSFVSQEEILSLVETLYIELVKTVLRSHHITEIPFPRITYEQTMKQYNTDKPDMRKNKSDPAELAFAFITDFPMFEKASPSASWTSAHHPFTMMKEEDMEFLQSKKLGKIRANSYDFVLNGYEIASGSIRINNADIQKQVFNALGLSDEDVKNKFGHMLEAFRHGAPPHGGIAPGIDRFVMIAANEPNIREVIAFPKTGDARDPMMDAPSELTPAQKKELRLK